MLKEWASVVQVRDGVVIDRDSQTAVDRLKYDYEVVPPGTRFDVCIDLENATNEDLALFGAAVFEWHMGSSLGGFTSRGLGRFHLECTTLTGVDMSCESQRRRFLTETNAADRYSPFDDWEGYFRGCIKQQQNGAAVADSAEE